ncbi:Stage II sporulation protein E (SpoIIE) [Posidoniimonas polymericola]|uniref:Stage II sporulation protein E (SpoIIE) n=1 Tax=Posidoniimonas polymericola TaxID=2528002 RepID=A0A5C5YDL3_9BACT|nr:SpoIIE family protein phosphatase [Posidoniimonas polymericola]TWT73816.1 Stage II sporulation protein E (SpoIIE) [Posidoniimonas polymericola]
MPTDDQPFEPPTILMPAPGLGPSPYAPGPGLPEGMPATVSFAGEEALFEQRITAILSGTTQGLRFDLADFFVLDDRTAELRTVASTGKQQSSSRPIEDAPGDLTALAGEAVVLEDGELMRQFGVPRRCGAAVCVPVSSDSTIHGTLWLYSRVARPVSDPELQLIEIVAGRLAVELERRELLKPAPNSTNAVVQSEAPTEPSALLLPTDALQLDELEVAGLTEATLALHDWHTLSDGRVLTYAAAFVGAPGTRDDESQLALQAARIALRSHAEHAANAGRLLNRVADTLSEACPGGSGVSIAASLVDPGSGEGSYALAGAAIALRIRASQQHAEATDDPPVGWDADQRHTNVPFELEIRERLVLAVGDPRSLDERRAKRVLKAFARVTADEHRQMDAWRALELAARRADSAGGPLDAAVALRRR